MKANCWQVMSCGREAGGDKAHELGVCPAAQYGPHSGVNAGEHGGRICWAVAGTFCEGHVQGTFASKRATCTGCEVFRTVQEVEGAGFQLLAPMQEHHALFEQFVSLVSIVEALNAVVCVSDFSTHEILFVNPYAQKLFGSDIVGKPSYEAFHLGQAGVGVIGARDRLIVDGYPSPPVVREVHDAVIGRWFQCTERAIRWWNGQLVRLEIAFDITERKKTEEFREQYVGLVGHDLRNPLYGILLHARSLKRSLSGKGLADECASADQVIAAVQTMDTLIADLLETVRLESGKLELRAELIDLRSWVPRVVRRVTPANQRARVALGHGRGRVKTLADPRRLERVVDNLLGNALKYSGDGSVGVSVRQQQSEAIVSVIDHGVGVSREDLPKLFQRFYRAANTRGVPGLGLGLYSARLIVEAHGGRIWAESQAGQGTQFHFALPLAAD